MGQDTVFYFAKSQLVGVLMVIRLRNDFQPYHWTSWASRVSGKMKKASAHCSKAIGKEGQDVPQVLEQNHLEFQQTECIRKFFE